MGRIRILIYFFLGLFPHYRKKIESPIVLFWHDVAGNASVAIEGESFRTSVFIRQIKYLMNHYEIISMDEFYRRYENHCFTNREVVLTFDDGYKNNLFVVAPILKKYNLPFTVFVSANNVEEQKRFYVSIPRLVIIGAKLDVIDIPMMSYHNECNTVYDRIKSADEIEHKIKYLPHDDAVRISEHLIKIIGAERYGHLLQEYPNGSLLNWEDINILVRDYDCTIGSHCMDHCICHAAQKPAFVKQQIEESKKLIEKRTGLKCVYFAYPNGDHTYFSDEIVTRNYRMGFSTERIPVYTESNIGSLGRLAVPSSMLIFKYALTMGLYKQFIKTNK